MNVMNFALAHAMGSRYEKVDDDQRRRASLIAMLMPSPALGLIGAKTVLDKAEEEASDRVEVHPATEYALATEVQSALQTIRADIARSTRELDEIRQMVLVSGTTTSTGSKSQKA